MLAQARTQRFSGAKTWTASDGGACVKSAL